MRLDGKVAIVSGAARGAGAVIARVLVEEGASALLVDVKDDEGEATAAALGDRAAYARCDITDEDDWRRAVDACVARFGSVTTLVNNAAVLHLAPLWDTTPDDFARVMSVNPTRDVGPCSVYEKWYSAPDMANKSAKAPMNFSFFPSRASAPRKKPALTDGAESERVFSIFVKSSITSVFSSMFEYERLSRSPA